MVLHSAIWTRWGGEPASLIAITVVAGWYAVGVRVAGRHAGGGRRRPVQSARARCFAVGVLVLAIALCSPLDALTDDLFVAHMTQHVLLATVAPPFLVLGAPAIAMLWTLPRASRRWLARAARQASWLRRPWQVLTIPVVAGLLHAAAVWLWHAPKAYELALRNGIAHAAEHASFVATACLMWWAILDGGHARRARYAAGILVLFATMMHTGALGALMTVSTKLWYPLQGTGARAWGLTALQDQQLAGLTMWVVGGLLYVAAMSALFVRWISAGARRRGARVVPAVASAALLAGCHTAQPSVIAGGDVARGRKELGRMSCGTCHTIAGVRTANGQVGPPLTGIASRAMLAGRLPNTPDNMMRWIKDAPSVDSATAMPSLHVPDQQARDVVAYLYTLK